MENRNPPETCEERERRIERDMREADDKYNENKEREK